MIHPFRLTRAWFREPADDAFWHQLRNWNAFAETVMLILALYKNQERSTQDADRLANALSEVEIATNGVALATSEVRQTIDRMAEETSRTQRVAIWVAVVMTIVGSVVGGFAGAIAAQLIGN